MGLIKRKNKGTACSRALSIWPEREGLCEPDWYKNRLRIPELMS